jgi:serpin B
VTAALARSNAAFAFDLYQAIRGQSGNLFFSPSSISTALAMTYAGARGNTATQMERVLHFGDDAEKTHGLFARFAELLGRVQEEGQVQLDTANSLWPHSEHPFLQEYLSLVERYYGTTITPVDYGNGMAAAAQMNAWVERKTQGRITDLISSDLDPLTRLILVNAIYFKAKWGHPFEESDTVDQPFWIGERESASVPMMRMTKQLGYAHTDGVQILGLPYIDRRVGMLILLPEDRTGIDGLEQRLAAENLQGWCDHLGAAQVDVSLPRFRMRGSIELSGVLAELGMAEAFDEDQADFSGMDGRQSWLYISRVIHKAFVDVDEQGTEAAAATAAIMLGRSISSFDPITFCADHPFLVVIREQVNGHILFLGRVVNPVE